MKTFLKRVGVVIFNWLALITMPIWILFMILWIFTMDEDGRRDFMSGFIKGTRWIME